MKVDATALRRKMLLRLLMTPVLALAAWGLCWLIIYYMPRGILSGGLNMLLRLTGMSYDEAYNVYRYVFVRRMEFWLWATYVLFFAGAVYYVVRRMSQSFTRVAEFADKLLDEGGEDVKVPAEFDFLGKKLSEVKRELVRRQQVAQQAEARKNDLVLYLAHDIKTPLTSVIGYLSFLQEAPDMPDEQRARYIGITLEKACRLEQLVDEFFDITRFNLQTIALDCDTVHLAHMLQQMAEEFYPMLAPQGKRIEICCPEDLTVWADPDKLARVLNNILKNAVSYSDPDTDIRIEASEQPDTTYISIENRGKTIPAHKLDSIFEKFYRLDSARSSHTGGAGLGLAIAREIVQAHGGSIAVRSQDGVTVFEVKLPRAH